MQPGWYVTPNVRLVSLLGQGGMGSVWLADHLALSSRVAVKFVSADLASSEVVRERFAREARASAQVKSPHIVQVFDQGIAENGVPYIVMELLEGEDLGATIERRGAIPLPELSRIVTQACRGLSKAHAAGVVHRDIKPDNIFLVPQDGEPFVKLLDFGVAKQTANMTAASMTVTGSVLGTPYYMSPEQMLGSKDVDPRSDLWSLAVTIYHAVTGDLPFTGESLGALFVAIERAAFAPPSSARGDTPPELDTWFAKAMARDPKDRFQTAREMADSFEAAVASGLRASSLPTFLADRAAQHRESSTPAGARNPSIAGASFSQADATFVPAPSPKRRVAFAVVGAIAVAGAIAVTIAVLAGRASPGSAPAAGAPPTLPPVAAPSMPVVTPATTPSAPVAGVLTPPPMVAPPPMVPPPVVAGKQPPPSSKPSKTSTPTPISAPPPQPPTPPPVTDRGF